MARFGSSSKKVLIIGAGGGVGISGVQIAASAGARVIATTGERSIELVKKLGAHHVINYKSDWVQEVKKIVGDRGVDVIVDFYGGDSFSKALDVAANRARGAAIVGNLEGNFQQACNKNMTLFFEMFAREGLFEKYKDFKREMLMTFFCKKIFFW